MVPLRINKQATSRRRGMALIYIVVSIVALFGFASFAVDLGRVEITKTQLRVAADAAARAAVAALPQGTSAAQTAAVSMAANDSANGAPVNLTAASDVIVGYWNTSTNTFTAAGTPTNAVKVYARCTRARGNAVPLMFGEILGVSSCDTTASSVAALVQVTSPETQYVSAHGNPWLAGEAKGTLASIPDSDYDNPSSNDVHPWKYDIANPNKADTASTTYEDSTQVESTDYSNEEPWGSPSEFSITAAAGAIIEVSVPEDSSDEANNQGFLTGGTGSYYANGVSDGTFAAYSDDAASDTSAPGYTGTGNSNSASDATGSEHGLSNISTPINSMVGVFLTNSAADTYNSTTKTYTATSTPPPGLDFSSQSEQDYTALQPQIAQTFYVGTGQTSGSVQQMIVVPSNATRLFLGTMDGHEWSNNVGGYNATITEYQIAVVQ